MALTDTAVKNAKPKEKQYRLTDGQGLYLLIKPSGKKYWRLDYILHGTRKTYAMGGYPGKSLKQVRAERDEAKALVANGVDPVLHRKSMQEAKAAAADNTFERVAEHWFSRQKAGWTQGHARTVRGRLDRHIIPFVGSLPISEITPIVLLPVLRRVEAQGKHESAKRVRVILSQVFRFALSSGLADRDPAADLKGALTPPKAKPMAAITKPEDIAALLQAISGYQGDVVTRAALKLSALTFVRPGELRHMEWKEIVWIKEIWMIPSPKMKIKKDHTVPLSKQALAVLRELHQFTGEGKYVFPSMRSSTRAMSNNTVLAALRRMGFRKEEMTPHGFRAMASTTLHEHGWDHELIELQLAHGRKDKVAAAYDRSKRLPERAKMMQWYADHLEKLQGQGTEQGYTYKTSVGGEL